MLRAAITFFILGLISILFGAYNFAGVSIEVGKLFLGVFLILALVSFVASLSANRKPRLHL